MGLDDIIIPRMGSTYLEEFLTLFNMDTDIAYLHYRKENVHVEGQIYPDKFSISQMYSSIYFKQINETGKTVTRPEYINYTWIHWPNLIPSGMQRYDVPAKLNSIIHLKFLDTEQDKATKEIRVPNYEPSSAVIGRKSLLHKRDIEWMQHDLDRTLSLKSVQNIWPKLPSATFYFNLIPKCFHDTYYTFHYSGQVKKFMCPGPDRCKFPTKPGINCYNAVADYYMGPSNSFLNIHYTNNSRFALQDGCQP